MSSLLTLSFKLLWRNWRSGEVKILAGALVVAVAIVTAISVFTDRLETSLIKESATFLGADRVVESSQPIPVEWFSSAEEQLMQQARTTEFVSMVFSGEDMNLSSVKAVTSSYPILGHIEISDQPFAIDESTIVVAEGVPAPGTAWVDSRLLPMLQASIGDEVQVGDKRLTMTKVIINEPDRGDALGMMGPRLMMNLDDLSSTNVIQPGSRVTYRWLLGGTQSQLDDFVEWLTPNLNDHQRLIDLESSQQQLANALDRGKRFLLLAGIVGVLLAGVAIAIAAQHFASRHIDQVALMKSLGASANRVRSLYFFQLILLAFFSSFVGVALGEGVQRLVSMTLSALFPVVLGGASFQAYEMGVFTGFMCVVFFALPPLWHLPKIPPIKILRRELSFDALRTNLQAGLGLVAILFLIFIYSRNVGLTLTVFFSLLCIIVVSFGIARGLLALGKKIGDRAGNIWRLALASLQRNTGQTTVQILVFATAIMLLLTLTTIRTSLIDEWQVRLPEDAPNHILLNVAPHEQSAISELFVSNDFKTPDFSPMLRARLVTINGKEPTEKQKEENGVLRRELMMSWRTELPKDNEIIAGQWWGRDSTFSEDVIQPKEKVNEAVLIENKLGGVSVEIEVAKRLDIHVGDVLGFSVGGLNADVVVDSLRSVNRDSFEWYIFLAEPGVFDSFQPTFRTDVFLERKEKLFLNQLLINHPTIVVFEFDKILNQIRSIVDQVSRGVELVLWLVVFGGFMVLLAAVNSSMETRLQEAGLIRALGSSRKVILGSIWAEFSLLGFFAGVLAVISSEVFLLGLQKWLLDVPLQPHYGLWLTGIVLGTFAIGLLGLLSCRQVITSPPALVLRGIES
ncbi:MAG: ABC transporter permease [Cellvibrionaceae bacterium]